MPSSISSSEPDRLGGRRAEAPWRAVPALPWGRTLVLALMLFALAMVGWEVFWRSEQFRPSYRNSDGLWAMTRARLDREGPGGTAIIGSSRVLFDLDLEVWRDETGTMPVQMALEGTNPRPVLAHLANASDFNGLLVVGVTPPLFFTPGFGYREAALEHYLTETPSEWLGQRISMVIEPVLAFYHFDTALFTVLRRQGWWPEREDVYVEPAVRKLANMRTTREAPLWSRVEQDEAYREIVCNTWLAILNAPREMPTPEVAKKMFEELLDEVDANVRKIRERGGEVVFVRAPSSGPFREVENKAFPREKTWDVLLQHTGAVGVHFEDYGDLSDVQTPEWSHIRAGETERFTRALIAHLREALAARGASRPELSP
ncbi:MAG: hypothetical protein JSV80_04255 [Acidobacteriota bacterium]|nr:MAG: hypothetical protein JSV80_04255 [Acidobacteriota bacterium]